MVLKASKGPWQLSNDGHSMSVLLWKDEAKLWQNKPIEAYCYTAIASVSHFIAFSASEWVSCICMSNVCTWNWGMVQYSTAHVKNKVLINRDQPLSSFGPGPYWSTWQSKLLLETAASWIQKVCLHQKVLRESVAEKHQILCNDLWQLSLQCNCA